MATQAEVQAIIDLNLASQSDITATEHRVVETAILNFIAQEVASLQTQINAIQAAPAASPFLRIANYYIGDVGGSDVLKTVTFPNVGTDQYEVLGSLVHVSGVFGANNDVIFSIREKTSTSFKLALREVDSEVQNISFDYALLPF
jgi:hypothetical protein